MMNILIRVARGLILVSVLIFVGVGAVYGGSQIGEAGYVFGGVAGFCVSAVVFGVAAAILDMQKSLRVLAEAAQRAIRSEVAPA